MTDLQRRLLDDRPFPLLRVPEGPALISLKARTAAWMYPASMGRQVEIARCDLQIESLEKRIAILRSEPGASSGLLGAELIELLERTLKELKQRKSVLMGLH